MSASTGEVSRPDYWDVIEEISQLIDQGYEPELVSIRKLIDSKHSLVYDKRTGTLYLRKGNEYVRVEPKYAWFAMSYAKLKGIERRSAAAMPRIFISYSHKDMDIVYRLLELLSRAGVQVFVADYDPEPGALLWEKVSKAIDASDAVVVLYTKEAAASPFVNHEIGYAKGRGKLVVPLVERGVLPKGALSGVEYVDFDRSQPDAAITKLLVFLSNLAEEKVRTGGAVSAIVALGLMFFMFLLLSSASSKG